MLAVLFHRRWALPILAALHDWKGGKFVTLVNRLGASREAMQQTLCELMRRQLVRRNPGRGHPMRPEYILTSHGAHLGPATSQFMRLVRLHRLEHIALLKWSMPVLFAMSYGPRRFSELQDQLPSITARALTLSLKDLVAAGLINRQIVDGYPPAALYALAREGETVTPALAELAAQLGRLQRFAT